MRQIPLALIRAWADRIAETDERDTEAGFLDTLDGECSALDIADRVIAAIVADEALAEACKAEEVALRARRDRIEARARQKRRIALELLDAIGVRKLERPRATISVSAGRERVVVEDESSLPTQLMTVKTVTAPDLKAIKASIDAGEPVPGAVVVRGDPSLALRVA